MRPDPSRHLMDERVAAATVEERVAWTARKRAVGFQLVWQQLDQAGITSPMGQAEFLLRRLYPEMAEPWFTDILGKLAARHAEGRWKGLTRPRGIRPGEAAGIDPG